MNLSFIKEDLDILMMKVDVINSQQVRGLLILKTVIRYNKQDGTKTKQQGFIAEFANANVSSMHPAFKKCLILLTWLFSKSPLNSIQIIKCSRDSFMIVALLITKTLKRYISCCSNYLHAPNGNRRIIG